MRIDFGWERRMLQVAEVTLDNYRHAKHAGVSSFAGLRHWIV